METISLLANMVIFLGISLVLYFKSEKLISLARKLERYLYNVNISFEDDSIKNICYSGILEKVTK